MRFALVLLAAILLVSCGDKKNPSGPGNDLRSQLVDRWWSRQGYGDTQTKDYYFYSNGKVTSVVRYQSGSHGWACDGHDETWEILDAQQGKVRWGNYPRYLVIESLGTNGIRLLEFEGDAGVKGDLRNTYLPENDLTPGARECCPTCPGPGRDSTPPTAISDLRVMPWGKYSVRLFWTSPSDETSGRVHEYSIRYSNSPITNSEWAGSISVNPSPTPAPAGQPEELTVTSVGPNSKLYWAIKSRDNVPNQWSALSNLASCYSTPGRDLTVGSLTTSSAKLAWTAPGEIGTGVPVVEYDIRYNGALINEGNWLSSTRVVFNTTPKNSGQPEEIVVTGLQKSQRYYFALRYRLDASKGWSDISPVVTARTLDN
jgi:hypothetical protein